MLLALITPGSLGCACYLPQERIVLFQLLVVRSGPGLPVEPAELGFQTSIPMPEAQKNILDSLARRKASIKLSHDTEIVASLGSEAKTRLLGGMWIDRRNFPRQVAVSLGQSEIGTKVNVIVTDKMGFGSRVGMRDKFRLVMKEDAEWIRSGFLDAK